MAAIGRSRLNINLSGKKLAALTNIINRFFRTTTAFFLSHTVQYSILLLWLFKLSHTNTQKERAKGMGHISFRFLKTPNHSISVFCLIRQHQQLHENNKRDSIMR